jgi:hypothetical protein
MLQLVHLLQWILKSIVFNGSQIPILLTLSYHTLTPQHIQVVTTKSFLTLAFGHSRAKVDKTLLSENVDTALKDLWSKFFTFLDKEYQHDFNTIFIHNLGGFDGYFIYKGLSNFTSEGVSTIIDKNNKFIIINFNISKLKKIVFKDSLRIIPTSLNDLCKVLNTPGKINL